MAGILFGLTLVLAVYMFLKNENTFRQHMIINDAIYQYGLDNIRNGRAFDLSMHFYMESYEATLFRLWDWGYTCILPPEKFELIKDYIKKK